ncbi:hypothetical protein BD289DRAFT_338028, partial [Coniella lustricola]
PEAKKLMAACTACRKQKIKCDMPSEEPPCSRCERRGLSCVLHTSALRSHNTDRRQIALLGKDMSNVYSTLQQVCDKLGIEAPLPLLSGAGTHTDDDHNHATEDGHSRNAEEERCEDANGTGVYELSPPASPSTVQAPIDPIGGAGTSTSPHTSLHTAAAINTNTGNAVPDLVSKGLLTHDRAEALVQRYLLHLDRFLYGIASHYQSAAQVRTASPTLLAAMCAVAAFQQVPRDRATFDLCYREYRSLVSSSLFEKRGVEYIRALCIGSFWLLDSSRILLSDAVRRAADIRLHRYWHRLTDRHRESRPGLQGADEARDRVRLWFLIFIADRHLSILHNRDALTRQEKDAIENRDMSLLVIMGQIRDVLGSERPRPLPKSYVVQFTHFSNELDRWYQKYSSCFEPDEHIGDFPLAGLTMHYQYARLYLGHHIFQSLNHNHTHNNNNIDTTPIIPVHFLPAAQAARQAALTIFSIIVDNAAFRNNITGMPHYFHVMITFAGHCLLDMITKYRDQLGIGESTPMTPAGGRGGVEDDLNRVTAALALFARSPAATAPQHPIARALVGLTRKLNECTASLGVDSVL